ncbi:MAG: hypothetical protein LLF94_07645 [Chlamydiales bacterium]|nr:hypothetical protein [Chlamydiales bacterium]
MRHYLLSVCLVLGSTSVALADAPPAYVQVQIDNFTQQIAQLQTQKDLLVRDLNAVQGSSDDANVAFKKQQIQTQIDQLNRQITFLEQQKANLIQSSS